MEILEEQRTGALAKSDKGYKVIIATPGQGTSGFYSEDLLRTYAASTWPAGTHSYLDHSKTRTPEKMIGVFTEDAHYEDNVGVVSYMKPFKHWQAFVEEVFPYTGMSMAVGGDGKRQVVNGKETLVVESLTPSVTNTVDLVSYAGRGGKIVESLLTEALNPDSLNESVAGDANEGNKKMTPEQEALLKQTLTAVESLVASNEAAAQKLEESLTSETDKDTAVAAAVEATRKVESAEIPQARKDALIEGIKNGNLDVEDSIADIVSLREEIEADLKTKLEEQSGVRFSESDNSSNVDNHVKGW